MHCQVQKINDPYQHLENRLSTLKSGPAVMYFGILLNMPTLINGAWSY